MTEGRWRISVTPPDWGQDHLSLEAVVAYVDGELAPGPHTRAAQHLGQCPECATQVSAQGQARKVLRTACGPSISSSLLSSLRAIPQDADLPGPPQGLAVTAEGQVVSVLRPERVPVSPLVPAAADAPTLRVDMRTPPHHTPHATPPHPAPRRPAGRGPARRSPAQLRLRVGTGIAVSGLAVGALLLTASGADPSGAPVPGAATPGSTNRAQPGNDPLLGGLNGSTRGVDAQLRLGGGTGGPGPAAPTQQR